MSKTREIITSNRQKCGEGACGDEKREKDVQKKTIYGALLIAILALNLFLTLQSPEGTVGLSEGVRHWLERFGFFTDFHTFRSNAHLVMFFAFGVIFEPLWSGMWLELVGDLACRGRRWIDR